MNPLRRALGAAVRDEYQRATARLHAMLRQEPAPGVLRRQAAKVTPESIDRVAAQWRGSADPIRDALTGGCAARAAALPREDWMCDGCTLGAALRRPCDAVCRRGWAARWDRARTTGRTP